MDDKGHEAASIVEAWSVRHIDGGALSRHAVLSLRKTDCWCIKDAE